MHDEKIKERLSELESNINNVRIDLISLEDRFLDIPSNVAILEVYAREIEQEARQIKEINLKKINTITDISQKIMDTIQEIKIDSDLSEMSEQLKRLI